MDDEKHSSSSHAYDIVPLSTNKSKIKVTPAMTDHVIPKHPFSCVISGRSGSGKTQLLLNLLTRPEFYKNYFDLMFVFSNTAQEGADDLYDHLNVPDAHMFKPNKDGLAQLKHIIKTSKKHIKKDGIHRSPKILVIFDDVANERKFLASDEYLKLHIMNRHYNISTFSLTQSYMKIPRSCRMQISALMYFKGKQTESERISDEHCPNGYKAKEFLKVIDHATHKPYEFMYINYKAPNKEQYRRCLHTIMELKK